MARRVFRSFEEGKKKWDALAMRFDALTPRTFRGAMQKVENLSKRELASLVYGAPAPANRRTGQLKQKERLLFEGETAARLSNAASSTWKGVKTNYAAVVAKGKGAMSRVRGRYAWMVNPHMPRPTTLEGWIEAAKAGAAVLARTIKGVPAKPWRDKAIEQAQRQGLFVREFEREISAAVDEANREAGGG